MKLVTLLDTGPLVAFLHRRDHYHRWAVRQLSIIEPPLLTCEPVLTEACLLMSGLSGGSEAVLELVETGLILVDVRLSDELIPIRKLMVRYANVPMSLADACLVRMSERHAQGIALTLDGHFRIYRKHGRQVIPLLIPEDKDR